jgi:hypothetical protein
VIVTPQTRLEDARRTLESTERHIRELREEEQQAIVRRDYAAATAAARARMLSEEVYQQAYAVIVRGGRKK